MLFGAGSLSTNFEPWLSHSVLITEYANYDLVKVCVHVCVCVFMCVCAW